MNRLLLIVLALSFISTSHTQNAEFQWSEVSVNAGVSLQNPKLVFPKDSGYTVYSVEEKGQQYYAPKVVYITKFDTESKILSTLEFDLPKRSQMDATLLNVIEGNGKLYFFSHVAVKKDGKNVLYAQIYDDATATISDISELFTLPIERVNNSGFFEVVASEDKNTIAVLVNKPFEKKTKETIEVVTFDAQLNTLSETQHTLPSESERAYRETLFVENDGTISIVKKTDVSKKEPITTVITIQDNALTEQQVSSDGFYISDSKVVTIGVKQYLFGFATDNAKPVISMGGAKDNSFFVYDIKNQTKIIHQEWSKETIKRVLGKGYIDLKVKDILVDNDEIYLIGDCYSKDSKAIEGKNFEYNYTHNFGPGVVIKLNIVGNVFYETPLSYGEDYLNKMETLGSFYPYLKDGKLQVLANEKESVLKDKKIVMGYDKINAKAIVLQTFDDEGQVTITPFWNSEVGGESDVTAFAPTKTLQLSDTIFYIHAIGNKYQKFGKMTLK